MARTYKIVRRKWKVRKPLYWIMVPELLGVVGMLVLFGIQQPDLFRTLFWQIGFDNGLNSDPNMILYAYANHRPLPTVPFVWSQTLTNFNVAISVLSLFILLAKMIATIMKVFYPIFAVIVHLALAILYAVSVYGQAGPDYADPRYPSPSAWYIRMGCDIARPYGAYSDCQMAKGTFAVTVYMMFIYLVVLGWAIWSMLPNKELDRQRHESDEEEYGSSESAQNKQWEMQPPQTPRGGGGPNNVLPFTPRTQAFHTLDRKLPLRG